MDEQLLAGFWDELSKIAQEVVPAADQGEVPLHSKIIGRVAGGIGGLAGAGMAGTAISKASAESLLDELARSGPGSGTSEEQMRKLRDIIAPGVNVRMPPNTSAVGGAMMARHIPPGLSEEVTRASLGGGVPIGANRGKVVEETMKKGLTIVPRGTGPHVAAHELSHALVTQKAPWLRNLRVPGLLAAGLAAPAMAIAPDPDSTTAKVAPLVGLAGVLPILGEEGFASIRGNMALKRLGVSPEQMARAHRQQLKAFGSYAGILGGVGVGAPLAIRGIRKLIERRKARAAAAAPAEAAPAAPAGVPV